MSVEDSSSNGENSGMMCETTRRVAPVPDNRVKNKLWDSYCSWATRNQIPVSLLDETAGHLLYWAPTKNDKEHASQWREVLWGCLQLHRLIFDLATIPSARQDQSFGTSIAVDPGGADQTFYIVGMRVAITVLQNLSPVVQELVRCPQDVTRTTRRQAVVRAWVERIRFLARLCLVASYWRCLWKHHHHQIDPGLLLHGGMFYRVHAPTVDHELATMERRNYVGRRTGRRLGSSSQRIRESKTSRQHSAQEDCPGRVTLRKLRLVVSELLYICRPVVTAEAERTSARTLRGAAAAPAKAWLVALIMDVVSLQGLQHAAQDGNALTKSEVKRRMMRLLLYLLRAPIWERYTRPTLDHLDAGILQRVPILGQLVSNYCWEIVHYWKSFGAEEG